MLITTCLDGQEGDQFDEEWICGTVIDLVRFPEHKMDMTQLGGKYITAHGIWLFNLNLYN